MRLLVVTAVEAEAQAVRAPEGITVVAVGVGTAAAAAGTARILALAEARGEPYAAVVSAGIAGGFATRTTWGSLVIAARCVAADLGADSPSGFLPLAELGFGESSVDCDKSMVDGLRTALPAAVVGDVLTVSTVTGTAERAAELAERHPDAAAEAMEGYGVAVAAALAGVACVEVRAISNPVGPRDRAAWRIGDALTALAAVGPALDSFALHG